MAMADGGRPTIAAHGLAVTPPSGWEARIAMGENAGVAGATTNPVLHAASVSLPEVRGDFGGGVVERMGPQDVFIALVEYDREAAGTPLFAEVGLPQVLNGARFRTDTLQRAVSGHSGAQWFCQVDGRAFCLYVVLGAHQDRWRLAKAATEVVRTIHIG